MIREDFRTGEEVKDMMTSELVYYVLLYNPENLADIFGTEYIRRLRLLGLSDQQICEVSSLEKAAIGDKYKEERRTPWAQRRFLEEKTDIVDLPSPEELTLSELIMAQVQVDREWKQRTNFYDDETDVWYDKKGPELLLFNIGGGYTKWFDWRTEKLKWSKEQKAGYIINERSLSEKDSWGKRIYPWKGDVNEIKISGDLNTSFFLLRSEFIL